MPSSSSSKSLPCERYSSIEASGAMWLLMPMTLTVCAPCSSSASTAARPNSEASEHTNRRAKPGKPSPGVLSGHQSHAPKTCISPGLRAATASRTRTLKFVRLPTESWSPISSHRWPSSAAVLRITSCRAALRVAVGKSMTCPGSSPRKVRFMPAAKSSRLPPELKTLNRFRPSLPSIVGATRRSWPSATVRAKAHRADGRFANSRDSPGGSDSSFCRMVSASGPSR
mmetsp:Transcript_27835/g.83148  ORF Transcript_27835/g.83148 Transcript_27835/m.83148 type:complete len:227 (-) Transcript_27835:316-996(-)